MLSNGSSDISHKESKMDLSGFEIIMLVSGVVTTGIVAIIARHIMMGQDRVSEIAQIEAEKNYRSYERTRAMTAAQTVYGVKETKVWYLPYTGLGEARCDYCGRASQQRKDSCKGCGAPR